MQQPPKNTQNNKLAVLLLDGELNGKIASDEFLQVFHSPGDLETAHHHNIFIISTASNLSGIIELIREANQRNHLKALLLRSNIKFELILKLMSSSDVKTLKNTLVFEESSTVIRIINAWKLNAQHQLIADASVIRGFLYIVSCSLKMYKVGFEHIPALRKIDNNDRENFRIDEEGRSLYWKQADIHFGLETLLHHSDPG